MGSERISNVLACYSTRPQRKSTTTKAVGASLYQAEMDEPAPLTSSGMAAVDDSEP